MQFTNSTFFSWTFKQFEKYTFLFSRYKHKKQWFEKLTFSVFRKKFSKSVFLYFLKQFEFHLDFENKLKKKFFKCAFRVTFLKQLRFVIFFSVTKILQTIILELFLCSSFLKKQCRNVMSTSGVQFHPIEKTHFF